MPSTIVAEDWITYRAKFSPEFEAAHDLASNRRFTYTQFDARISQAAAYLQRTLGVERGERVAVMAMNDSDVFEIQFACQRIGAIFLPLNWRLAVPELEFICNDATPEVLICGTEFEEAGRDVAKRSGIAHFVTLANGQTSDYETGLTAAGGVFTRETMATSDIWTVMYTSGTTGRPKGALITYQMVFYNAVHSAQCVDLSAHSKNLVVLPTFHTGGLNVYANPVFHSGGSNVVMRAFDSASFLELMSDKTLHLTHVLGVPTNFLMSAQEPGFAQADLSHIESLGVGGAAAPLALIELYAEKGLMMQQMWGMTETAPLGLVLPKAEALNKVGASGLPPNHTRLKVCDEHGDEVPPGTTGELMIKGPTVTPGYWNRPEANATSFREDGWFHTGDAARVDEDGFYFIVDRWKDMFISGGENVYPAEVENVIYGLDGMLENAVIGIPHDKWGEVGRAFIVLKAGSNLSEDAIVAHCKENLATFKVPKEVRMIDELPHNATGKVLKHQLPRD
jgi:fatty-acyl-CoA synthase